MSRSTRKEQLIQIPFTAGMNQSADAYMAPLGDLQSVQNMRAVAGGFLRKRVGCTTFAGTPQTVAGTAGYPVVSSTIPEKPTMVAKIGNANVIGITSGAVFALDETNGGTAFQYIGRHSTATPVKARAALLGGDLTGSNEGFGRSPSAVAINSDGYVIVAGVTDGNVVHAFIESPDGVRVWRATDVTASKVQCFAVGTTLFLVYQNGTDVRAMRLVPSSAGVSYVGGFVTATVATLTGAGAYWDTSAYDGTNWYLVYQNGAAQCTVAQMTDRTATATATFAVTGTVPLSITAMPSMAAANAVWVGYNDDPAGTSVAGYLVYSTALALTLGKTTVVAAGSTVLGPPLIGPYYSRRAAVSDAAFMVVRRVSGFPLTLGTLTHVAVFDATGSAVLSESRLYHVIPVSKPDARMRFWATSFNASANFVLQQHFLVRLEDLGQIPRRPWFELSTRRFPAMGLTYGPTAKLDFFHAIAVGSAADSGTTRSLYPLPVALTTVSGVPLASVELYEYTTQEQVPHRAVREAAQGLLMSGQPAELYGQSINALYTNAAGPIGPVGSLGASELGWPHAPTVIDSATAGGNVDAGSRNYKLLFEWVDIYGRRHRSAPSAPFAITLAVASQVTLTALDANLTQRQYAFTSVSPPRLLVYRQLANGASYKRCPGSSVAYDNLDGCVTFVDNSTDATIAGNESLYTDGGVIENVLAPSCQFFVVTEDRVCCGGLWDPTILRFSKILVPEEQIAFTDDPSFDVALFAPCTGLAYMDGAVVAFTRASILLISGEGPNDQGVGGFSTRYLTKELGCIDYKTIVETNIGVLFQSADGYYLLPRGFGPPQAIGDAVRLDVHSGAAKRCLSSAAVSAEQTADGAGGSTYACWLTEDPDVDVLAFDAESSEGAAHVGLTGVGTVTQSHALGSGENRLLIVAVWFRRTSGTLNSLAVDIAGTALTLLDTSDTATVSSLEYTMYLYGLLEEDMPAGGARTITVTINGTALTCRTRFAALSWVNAQQEFEDVTFTTSSGDTSSVSQPNTAPGVGLDFIGTNSSADTPTATATQRSNEGSGSTRIAASSSATSPAALGWSGIGGGTSWIRAVTNIPALENYGTRLLVYDTAGNRWFLDKLTDIAAEIGAWTDGLALCTEDLDSDTEPAPIRYQDDLTKTTEDGATFIEARVETPLYHPFGVGGWGHVRKAMVAFTGSNFYLNVWTRANGGDWQVSQFAIAASSDDRVRYREIVLEEPKCSTLEFRIFDSELSGADVSFGVLGVALEVEDSGGLRLMDPGERA